MLQSEHISVAGVVIALLFAADGGLKFRGGGGGRRRARRARFVPPPHRARAAAACIALLFAAYGVLKFRGGGSRLDLLLSLVIALGVALVSIVPQIFEPVSRLLGLENRAFALLGLANLLLFALFLNLLARARTAGRRRGEVATGLAVRDYEENFLSPQERLEGHPGEILIIVPAYDEEGGIQGVLRRIPDEVLGHPVKTVVVDDGSKDATAALARAQGVPGGAHGGNRD